MIQGSLRQGIAVEDATQLLIAGVVGVLLGLLFAYIPATYVAIGISAIFLVILAIRSPQYALIVILIILSTVFPDGTFPRLNVGGIHIWITDLVILGLFGLIIIRLLAERDTKQFRSPIVLPLMLFLFWAFLTAIRGYYFHENSRNAVIIETRIALYYSIILCVMFLIRDEKNINNFLKWFYFLAVIASIMILVQFTLGYQVSFLNSGKIYAFSSNGGPEVTRVQGSVGEGLVTYALILKSITLFIDRMRSKSIVDLVQWMILAAGMIATFTRTTWIMIVMALVLAAFLVGRNERRRIIMWAIVAVGLLFIISVFTILLQPKSQFASLINAGVGRVSTIFQLKSYTSAQESTVVWRNFEYTYGIPEIYNNPIFGIGLGAQYRPTLSVDYVGFEGQLYTHNSNLWIAMKTGIVGFILYLWFSLTFAWHAIRNRKHITTPAHRGFVLGSALSIFLSLFAANIHPIGMTLEWIPVIAVVIGLSEAIILYYKKKSEKLE
jgi:O-antigen ligase